MIIIKTKTKKPLTKLKPVRSSLVWEGNSISTAKTRKDSNKIIQNFINKKVEPITALPQNNMLAMKIMLKLTMEAKKEETKKKPNPKT